MQRQRWLIIADSLALPRPGVGYQETWPYLLQRNFTEWDWVGLAQRSSTSKRLVTDGDAGKDCLEFYEPNGVILHIGICDCAPRLYRFGSICQKIVYRLPSILGRLISVLVERYRGRQVSNALVRPKEFKTNFENYLQRCKKFDVNVIALEIMPVGQKMINKNAAIVTQIKIYNRILHELQSQFDNLYVERIFNEDCDIDSYTTDGYHLNALGSRLTAEVLSEVIKRGFY